MNKHSNSFINLCFALTFIVAFCLGACVLSLRLTTFEEREHHQLLDASSGWSGFKSGPHQPGDILATASGTNGKSFVVLGGIVSGKGVMICVYRSSGEEQVERTLVPFGHGLDVADSADIKNRGDLWVNVPSFGGNYADGARDINLDYTKPARLTAFIGTVTK